MEKSVHWSQSLFGVVLMLIGLYAVLADKNYAAGAYFNTLALLVVQRT